ncbi:MAG TPA: PEP-utilizing enzyme [Bdellovibrionales bacterium]|nr:PEP-utilizing enzyme [Bdellovibrionales bacterium]
MKTAWTREESKERFPYPVTPLGWSILQDALRVNLRSIARELGVRELEPQEVSRLVNHYVYARKPFFGSLLDLRPRPWRLAWLGAQVVVLYSWLLASFPFRRQATLIERIPLVGIPLQWLLDYGQKRLSLERAPLGSSFHAFARLVVKFILVPRAYKAIRLWNRQAVPAIREMASSNEEARDRVIDEHNFFAFKNLLTERGNRFLECDFLVHFTKGALFGYLAAVLKNAGIESPADLTIGLKDNVALEMYKRVKQSGSFGSAYAHLTDNWDLYHPTLGEKREELERLLARYERADLQLFESEQSARRRQIRERVTAALNGSGYPLWFMAELIELFEKLVAIDEQQRFYSSLQYPAAKMMFNQLSVRWVARGMLKQNDDIYFLTLEDIESVFSGGLHKSELAKLVESRRATFEAAWTSAPPMELGPDLLPLEAPRAPVPAPAVAAGFSGVAASPGAFTGRARRIRNFDDLMELKRGEVAILLTPNPVYGPFLDQAGAIVCETGGLLSHGAVVARELSIPAVVGAEGIFEGVADGAPLKVDGSAGTVHFV